MLRGVLDPFVPVQGRRRLDTNMVTCCCELANHQEGFSDSNGPSSFEDPMTVAILWIYSPIDFPECQALTPSSRCLSSTTDHQCYRWAVFGNRRSDSVCIQLWNDSEWKLGDLYGSLQLVSIWYTLVVWVKQLILSQVDTNSIGPIAFLVDIGSPRFPQRHPLSGRCYSELHARIDL